LLIMVLLTIIIYFCPIQCDSAKKLTEDWDCMRSKNSDCTAVSHI
jgi:hypothetical protein